MEKPDFKIKTDRSSSNFSDHLIQKDNHRIIFSAPFGTGKTTFLKDYFDRHNSEYQVFHLFPVNYSVASNEDIFELIKYDILFNFLSIGLDFEKLTIPKSVSFGFFVQNNPENIIMPFVRQIPLIGKQVAEVAGEIIKLYKQFELDHKNNQSDQEKTIIKFLEEINQTKGSAKEEDFYTQLICQIASQVKAKDGDKKTILIIDDLDRIDPDHIFRILNVFSAHFDHNSNENKFDFDKIILVCDINNIRKIYSNRYGQDVDFSGYIDKFYSKDIFTFELLHEIEEKLNELFRSIKLKATREVYDLYDLKGNYDVRFLLYLFFALNKSGYLSIRKLHKYFFREVRVNDNRSGPRINGRYFSIYDFRLLIVHQAVRQIVPDYDSFLNSLDYISENSEYNPYSDYKSNYLKMLIPFLSFPSHHWKLELNKSSIGSYGYQDYKLEWDIKPIEHDTNGNTTIKFDINCKAFKNGYEIPLENLELFKLTKETFDIVEKHDLNWIK